MNRIHLKAGLVAFACLPLLVSAASLNLADAPLGIGSGSAVKPNLMVILDDSGSMNADHTPDWIGDSICQTRMNSYGSGTSNCTSKNSPIFHSAAFNKSYYNPEIYYAPPKNADGTSQPDASTALVTSYPDTKWCTTNAYTTCGKNDGTHYGYAYPNSGYTYSTSINGDPYYYKMTGAPSFCSDTSLTTCQARRSDTYQYPKLSPAASVAGTVVTYPGSGVQVEKVYISSGNTYTKYSGRSDCNPSPDCSYAKELQNFANWYLYYRTRIKMMKSVLTRVFADISDTSPGRGFRVGFDRIGRQSSTSVLQDIAPFTGAQKSTFFTNVNDTNPDPYTPLRGALSRAGRLYAGALTGAVDPIEKPCQQNYTLLTTDGYWNTFDEVVGSYGPYKEDGSTSVGNQDGMQIAAAAKTTITTDVDGSNRKIYQIKCGPSNAASSLIYNNATGYTITGADDTARSQNLASWLQGQLAACPSPGAGSWVISRSGTIITVSWPVVGSTGNGNKFALAIKSTSDVTATLLGKGDVARSSGLDNPVKESTLSGGLDAMDTPTPYRDALNMEETLADVAMYYYKTDLRPGMADEVPRTARDDQAGPSMLHQHMVTFTMGLGVDGTLLFHKDYLTRGKSPDYDAIVDGTLNWPDPIHDTKDVRIDDLWHAAVNGRGQYFSAGDPKSVIDGFNAVIAGITAETGAGSGAASSTHEPVAGDNYAYLASYRTTYWNGDLTAHTIDLTSGSYSSIPIWSAAYKLGSVAEASRTLYTFDSAAVGADKKRLFTYANLSGPEQNYFDPTQLSQCPLALPCPGATSANLFSYLRGGVDLTSSGASYRAREAMLDPADAASVISVPNKIGDIGRSEPVYVTTPNRLYTDTGYSSFKSGAAGSRPKMVYVGSNDGFLHAFDATTGAERWAYLPVTLMPSLYKLADNNYSTNHRYYTDGLVTVGDVYDSTALAWKTILVAGMGKGGKRYVGIDVTDPTAPKVLWEFSDTNLGYSYGNAIITKLPTGATTSGAADIGGKWAVLFASGYNDASADGEGRLFVVNPITGAKWNELATTSSFTDSATPSPVGLSKIVAWADNPREDNTALYVYGGDLNGDLWRFKLADMSVLKLATLGEPVTTKPALGYESGNRVVYVGTGQYLEDNDNLDADTRTLFAIKDDGTTLTVPKGPTMVQQVFSLVTGSTSARTLTSNTMDWSSKRGWYINLPDSGERINLDPQLVLGTLIVVSNVPSTSASNSCSPGGYSWLMFIDATTGSYVNVVSDPTHQAGEKTPHLTVGASVIGLGSGKFVVNQRHLDGSNETSDVPMKSSGGNNVRRVGWRELIAD